MVPSEIPHIAVFSQKILKYTKALIAVLKKKKLSLRGLEPNQIQVEVNNNYHIIYLEVILEILESVGIINSQLTEDADKH